MNKNKKEQPSFSIKDTNPYFLSKAREQRTDTNNNYFNTSIDSSNSVQNLKQNSTKNSKGPGGLVMHITDSALEDFM